MITMTTARPLGSALKWMISAIEQNDAINVAQVTIALLNGANVVVSSKAINIRDGISDKLSYNVNPQAGQSMLDALLLSEQAMSTPTGYTDAVNAWRAGGATAAARRTALEAHVLTVGYLDSTLAGS